jgi:hypothetical protein
MMSFNSTSSTSSKYSVNQRNRNRYRIYLQLCKNEYISFLNSQTTGEQLQQNFDKSQFLDLLRSKNIQLPDFEKFCTGKFTICFKEDKYELTENVYNSTMVDSVSTTELGNDLNLTDLSIASNLFEHTPQIQNNNQNELIISNNILDKTIATEDINWEIKKISSHRMKNDKKQFKVHYQQQKNHRYMPPQYINESMLNATSLVDEYCLSSRTNKSNAPKRGYIGDILDITASEVDLVGDKYKTNATYKKKRFF